MRRLLATLMLSAVFLFIVSTPAQATVFWDWVDHLSGPGPFNGAAFEWRVVCFGGDKGVSDLIALKSGCLSGTKKNHKESLNFTIGQFVAYHNKLNYANPTANHIVWLTTFGPSYEIELLERRVELSAGVEGNVFYGSAFDPVWRYSIPLLVDWKPFAKTAVPIDATWRDKLTAQAGVVFTPTGFDDRDFGAIPGPLHTSSEQRFTFGVIWDLGARR